MMKMRRLGRHGPKVSAIALGCMRMARFAKPLDVQTDAEAIATIREAIDAGIDILNTGNFYGMGHSEALVGHAIKGRREQVFLSVKFGALVAPSFRMLGRDGRPDSVRNFLNYSLQRLGVDARGRLRVLGAQAGQRDRELRKGASADRRAALH
jgi:aryl-alcohol dehydrogenase-like predicted oxidoreductase